MTNMERVFLSTIFCFFSHVRERISTNKCNTQQNKCNTQIASVTVTKDDLYVHEVGPNVK